MVKLICIFAAIYQHNPIKYLIMEENGSIYVETQRNISTEKVLFLENIKSIESVEKIHWY